MALASLAKLAGSLAAAAAAAAVAIHNSGDGHLVLPKASVFSGALALGGIAALTALLQLPGKQAVAADIASLRTVALRLKDSIDHARETLGSPPLSAADSYEAVRFLAETWTSWHGAAPLRPPSAEGHVTCPRRVLDTFRRDTADLPGRRGPDRRGRPAAERRGGGGDGASPPPRPGGV